MKPETPNLKPFINQSGAFILDGGLATQLEARGCDLSDDLWSARLLLENPDLIRQVHLDYYLAGADCATTASYQATIPGFCKRGHSVSQAIHLIRLSTQLALEARELFWADKQNRVGRLRPLVAASIGPYGAYLANGAEYTGNYDLDEAGLFHWHQERWHILATSGADLLACETIPSFAEARAITHLLPETPQTLAWVSFSCRDGQHISDGTPIADCAAFLSDFPQILAVGINCTPPRYIHSLIQQITHVTDKPIVVYPNSGETYDPVHHCWQGLADASQFGTMSKEWRRAGAALIGGCCRTTPAHIRQIRDRFRPTQT